MNDINPCRRFSRATRNRYHWTNVALVLSILASLHGPAVAAIKDGPVDGYFDNLPLKVIAPMMVPPGVKVEFGPDVDQSLRIKWKGGPSWQIAMNTALEPVGLAAQVGNTRVHIDRSAPAVIQAVDKAVPSGLSHDEKSIPASTPIPLAPPVAVPAPITPPSVLPVAVATSTLPPPLPEPVWQKQGHWAAEAGSTLQEAATRWGDSIGLRPVFYGTYAYPIDAPFAFDGSFEEALMTLVSGFSTAEPKPLLDIWKHGDMYAVVITQGNLQ